MCRAVVEFADLVIIKAGTLYHVKDKNAVVASILQDVQGTSRVW